MDVSRIDLRAASVVLGVKRISLSDHIGFAAGAFSMASDWLRVELNWPAPLHWFGEAIHSPRACIEYHSLTQTV